MSVAELSRKIEANGIKIAKTFESDIFRGLSVETSHDNVDTLQEVAQAAHAWPVSRFQIAPIQDEDPLEDVKAANWTVHWATGVDKLHAAGVFGKGARVAVIDSGIDYNHHAVSISPRSGGLMRMDADCDSLVVVSVPASRLSVAMISSATVRCIFEGSFCWHVLILAEYDGSNEKKPKADPMDKINHGTHVAGIIAGRSDRYDP